MGTRAMSPALTSSACSNAARMSSMSVTISGSPSPSGSRTMAWTPCATKIAASVGRPFDGRQVTNPGRMASRTVRSVRTPGGSIGSTCMLVTLRLELRSDVGKNCGRVWVVFRTLDGAR